MMIIGALLFAYGGMLGLCLGLGRHYKQVWGKPGPLWLLRLLRYSGWAALVASLLLSVAAWGWAMGPVGWFGALSLAGVALVMGLPYAPRSAVLVVAALPCWGLWGWLVGG
ncbi:DUF3325 domain-containing protein [Pseudomonas alkylphenolica]|uniref:DUF3325 domain-containing protein n=1 Tax=Pseudomonas alkylphenolica TaxID=237609 RepID=UPI001E3EC9BD|nr:DUF3325 domain-containing protein [Pseudomonas alkylphenolica]